MPAFRGVIYKNESSSRFAALGEVSRMGSSNQELARAFSQRMRGEKERETTVEQKVALALRCDDAKMSLVV